MQLLQPILDMITGGVTEWFGQILAGVGAIALAIFSFFAGRKDERQRGQIRTQEEIIDAHETRSTVEDAVRRGGTAERDRQRMRYTRGDDRGHSK